MSRVTLSGQYLCKPALFPAEMARVVLEAVVLVGMVVVVAIVVKGW